MSRKLQETQTTVRCTRCQEAFRLSAEDSILFLREMQIEVECPACVNRVQLSVIPRSDKSSATRSVYSRGHSRGLAKSKESQGQTKIGLPPFKPLGKEPAPAPSIEATRSIPFAPIVPGREKKEKPTRHVPVSEAAAANTGKGWWGNQNSTTRVLLVMVAFLGVGFTATTVLLVKKSVGQVHKTNPELLSGVSGTAGANKSGSKVRIPSEDPSATQTGQKARD